MEQAFGIVEPEQQRPDEATAGLVTKTAHHTISGAQALHLEHGTRAREINKIQTLGHNAIERFVLAIHHRFALCNSRVKKVTLKPVPSPMSARRPRALGDGH